MFDIKMTIGIIQHIRRMWHNAIAWRIRHVSDNHFLMTMAVATGFIAGSAAFVLKWCVREISGLLTSMLHPEGFNPLLLITPMIGIMATGVFVRYILRIDIENGTSRLEKALKRHNYKMKRREMFGSMIASMFTLGFGGSAGGGRSYRLYRSRCR